MTDFSSDALRSDAEGLAFLKDVLRGVPHDAVRAHPTGSAARPLPHAAPACRAAARDRRLAAAER